MSDEDFTVVTNQVFVTTTFTGHWPVGVAAVAVAKTAQDAADMLNEQLQDQGLPGDATAEFMLPVELTAGTVYILADGNY